MGDYHWLSFRVFGLVLLSVLIPQFFPTRISAEEAEFVVTARVVDRIGRPLKLCTDCLGFDAVLFGPNGESRAKFEDDGTLQFGAVPAGHYDVVASFYWNATRLTKYARMPFVTTGVFELVGSGSAETINVDLGDIRWDEWPHIPAPAEKDRPPPGQVTIQVIEADTGKPIPDAVITPTRLLSEQGETPAPPGSYETDKEGKATIFFTADMGESAEAQDSISKVDFLAFRMEHPKFLPEEIKMYPIHGGGPPLEMESGATLSVTADLGEGTSRISDGLFVQFALGGWDSSFSPEHWRWNDAGELAHETISPGISYVRVAHLDEENRLFFSAPELVHLEKEKPLALHVSLLPAKLIQGNLKEVVPRPIKNGWVSIQSENQEHHGGMDHGFFDDFIWNETVPIDSEGTFQFYLPPCEAFQVVAKTEEWVSKGVLSGSRIRKQSFSFDDTAPIEIEMQPTASAVLKLVDRKFQPISGVEAAIAPQLLSAFNALMGIKVRRSASFRRRIVFRNGTTIQEPYDPFLNFLSRTSNEEGYVRFDGMPADGAMVVYLDHPDFFIGDDVESSRIEIPFIPGEEFNETLVMKPK